MFKINEAQVKKFIEMAEKAVKVNNIEYRYEIVNGMLVFLFDKKIPTNDRPNKRSHVLRIEFEEIIFQDYESISETMFNVFKNRIDELINQFYFDAGPKHKFGEQVVTRWVIKFDGSAKQIA